MGTTTPVPDLATSGLAFVLQDSGSRYGRYTGDPSRAQLDRYFHLDAADRELVDVRRGERNRLGFAVQLGTVRFLGTFLADPIDVPELVVAHVAAQLGIPDPGMFKGYAQRRSTQWEHAAGHAWEGAREEVCRSLGHDASADRELTEVAGELDAAYRAVAARLPENTAVRVETVDGRDRPVLTALDRLDEPPSLLALCTARSTPPARHASCRGGSSRRTSRSVLRCCPGSGTAIGRTPMDSPRWCAGWVCQRRSSWPAMTSRQARNRTSSRSWRRCCGLERTCRKLT